MGRLTAGGARNAAVAPEPEPVPFQIEHLECGALSEPQEGVRRQQRDVLTGGAIDLDEVASPEILDPHYVEGTICAFCESEHESG